MPEMVVAAVALKVAVVAPVATVTEAGTVMSGFLLASVRVEPPAGAFRLRVTVQLLTAPGPRLTGSQVTLEIAGRMREKC